MIRHTLAQRFSIRLGDHEPVQGYAGQAVPQGNYRLGRAGIGPRRMVWLVAAVWWWRSLRIRDEPVHGIWFTPDALVRPPQIQVAVLIRQDLPIDDEPTSFRKDCMRRCKRNYGALNVWKKMIALPGVLSSTPDDSAARIQRS